MFEFLYESFRWVSSMIFIFILGYTWTVKANNTDYPDDVDINNLQDEKLDRDGEIKATGTIQWDKGANIASADPLVPGADGNYFHVTGTTNFAAINAAQSQPGTVHFYVFDAILTMTHHAVNLILPGAANITTAAGDRAIFIEESADKWRCISYIKADGSINLGIGGQIAFPATQAPSAGANTLDDYEEGEWTPIIDFGGAHVDQTYTTRYGRYIKVGGKITVSCYIRLSAKGSSVGSATISGLPFTSIAGAINSVSVALFSVSFADRPQGLINVSSVVVTLQEITNAGNASNLNEGNFIDTSRFYLTATYFSS